MEKLWLFLYNFVSKILTWLKSKTGTSSVNAWYGWHPDKPDARDFKAKIKKITKLPQTVDLRAGFPPCYDQGQLGSCTANAIAAVLDFDMLKQKEVRATTPSRLFIYYNERVMEGTVNEDAGAEIRDGIKSVNKQGAPAERVWPYVISKFARRPSNTVYKKAMARQAVRYEYLDNTKLNDLQNCLASGFPFVFGFTVYQSFESPTVARTGVVPMPKNNEQVLGGHAVVAVGYDNNNEMFLCRNSWGIDWGITGYFWMPFNYLTNARLSNDFWVVYTVE